MFKVTYYRHGARPALTLGMWYDASDLQRCGTVKRPYHPDMDEPEKAKKTSHRRSSRMVMRIPLLIQSLGPSTRSEWEPVETVMVSLHGGMLRARNHLRVGDVLDIRVRDKERSARARVVWTSAENTKNGVELGFEILDEEGFWEVNFPTDRWSERTRPGKKDG
jgi:PilZ domain